jgi:NAD(P)-dependent dehydrogenase (short-subunit alcohol dehydrogenase family)
VRALERLGLDLDNAVQCHLRLAGGARDRDVEDGDPVAVVGGDGEPSVARRELHVLGPAEVGDDPLGRDAGAVGDFGAHQGSRSKTRRARHARGAMASEDVIPEASGISALELSAVTVRSCQIPRIAGFPNIGPHGTVALTFSPNLFAGRHVLVVGATSGIGAGIAAAFAAHGASVLVTGASAAEVERRAPAVGAAAVLDVRDGAAVKGVVDAQARLDVVVNCAGVIRRGEEHDPEIFADVVDINLVGMQRVCSAARGRLGERGGSIVNLASMLSFFGGGLVPAYSASKGGVAQLTKSLAIAYAADGIRVNAIAPGWIATALTAPLRDDPARDQSIRARTPLGRWGEPGDVAGAALFLASPAAAFVTGVVLPVDGGYLVS